MNLEDLGRLHAHLLRHRIIETRPVNRRMRPGERDLADLLTEAGPDGLERVNEFLGGQGLELVEYTDTDMPGIPTGGRVWLLTRRADEPPPAFFSLERLRERMKVREGESNESATVWFLHIWLLCLALLYTRIGRAVSAVSGYLDARFRREVLLQAVRDHLECLRNQGPEGEVEAHVFAILCTEKGQELSRRVGAFLDLMCEAGLLASHQDGEYEQTLLGAYEIARSFDRTLQHILPDEETLKNVANIAAPTAYEAEAES